MKRSVGAWSISTTQSLFLLVSLAKLVQIEPPKFLLHTTFLVMVFTYLPFLTISNHF